MLSNREVRAKLRECRHTLRPLLGNLAAWRCFRNMVEDEIERSGGEKPKSLLDFFRYVVENWETIYPIIQIVALMFGIVLPPLPSESAQRKSLLEEGILVPMPIL